MMKLSVIIPVYNEEKTIRKARDKVKNPKLSGISKEIIVVDDCSDDGTREILKNIGDKSLKILYQEKNMGKGSAILRGL